VVAKVQSLETPLLAQQHDHDAARPVETLAKELLNGVLGAPHWNAIDELEGRPKAMELRALVHVDYSIGRWGTAPHRIVQIALYPVENHLEDAKAAAKAFAAVTAPTTYCITMKRVRK